MIHEQKQIIYLPTSVGYLNGTIQIEDDIKTFDSEDEAIESAKETTSEYGIRTYVYKVTPIIQVDVGKIRVTKLNVIE